VRDVWKKMPTERHARLFLENAIWGGARFCPHCGSLHSRPLHGKSVRPGLYQCAETECRRQFTVTTKTPLHATKLDLRVWIAAMFLVLTSSKGISSVVMSRILGVNQKTAWKLGHAIRELMDDRDLIAGNLAGVVEVDARQAWPTDFGRGPWRPECPWPIQDHAPQRVPIPPASRVARWMCCVC
jgi:transposase-like protein